MCFSRTKITFSYTQKLKYIILLHGLRTHQVKKKDEYKTLKRIKNLYFFIGFFWLHLFIWFIENFTYYFIELISFTTSSLFKTKITTLNFWNHLVHNDLYNIICLKTLWLLQFVSVGPFALYWFQARVRNYIDSSLFIVADSVLFRTRFGGVRQARANSKLLLWFC